MNHERMLKVADMIEAYPDHFDMSTYATIPSAVERLGRATGWVGPENTNILVESNLFECGTTACIAGWAVWLWGAEAKKKSHLDIAAAHILDLDVDTANTLFTQFDFTDAKMAAEHLREMVRQDQER